jgi:hypothetical protein
MFISKLDNFMRNQPIPFLTVLAAALLSGIGSPLMAQTDSTPGLQQDTLSETAPDAYFINRAKNLARQAAITANGGLLKYRPEPAMFGPALQTMFTRNPNGSITFSFKGGSPDSPAPTLETVATVSPDGKVNLDYNGAIRGATSAPSAPVAVLPPASSSTSTQPVRPNANAAVLSWIDQDAFFAKARNLARQAAIRENGGLGRYRPEAAMFGPSAKTPAVTNANGSITFTFKGGAPGETALTTESVVTVEPSGSVNIQYNGPLR